MPELDDRLAAWTAAGLITVEQAERIRSHEGLGPAAQQPPWADRPRAARTPPTPGRRLAVAEAVGYVGGALAVSAVGLILRDLWPQLTTGGQLTLVALLTLLTAGAGLAIHGQVAAAMQRLTGVLWTATSVGAAWFAGLVADDVVGASPAVIGTSVGLVAAVVAGLLLVVHPAFGLQAATLIGLAVAVTSLLSLNDLSPDVFWGGLLVAGIGIAWLLLGLGNWIAPRRIAEVLGGLVALLALQVASFDDSRTPALVLALLLAAALVVLAVRVDAGHLLVVGAIGLFVLVPQVVFELFGDAIGAPATLLVVGLLLVLLSVGLGRARREVRGDADGATPVGRGVR